MVSVRVRLLAPSLLVVIAALLAASCGSLAADERTDRLFRDLESGNIKYGEVYAPTTEEEPAPRVTPPSQTLRYASAQEEYDQRIRLSVNYFRPKDSDIRAVMGSGFGLTLDFRLSDSNSSELPLYLSLGYIKSEGELAGVDIDINSIPMLFLIRSDGRASKGYLGAGIGVVRSSGKASSGYESYSDSTTDFAFKLLAGANVADNMFLEMSYLDGGDPSNTGFTGSIGMRF